MSPQPPDQGSKRPTPPGLGGPAEQNWRWAVFVILGLILAALILPPLFDSTPKTALTYTDLLNQANEAKVDEVTVNNDTGAMTGKLKDGKTFSVRGPHPVPDADLALLRSKTEVKFDNDQPNLIASLLPFLLPIGILIGFWVWMSRRAQGQMTGLMSIGRSKAKVYTTERPRTTFADVAGYAGV